MVVKINFSFFLKGTLVSFLYCFCSPDVQLVLTKRFYRWRVRWQTRNLTRENTRRFNSSQVCIGCTFITYKIKKPYSLKSLDFFYWKNYTNAADKKSFFIWNRNSNFYWTMRPKLISKLDIEDPHQISMMGPEKKIKSV